MTGENTNTKRVKDSNNIDVSLIANIGADVTTDLFERLIIQIGNDGIVGYMRAVNEFNNELAKILGLDTEGNGVLNSAHHVRKNAVKLLMHNRNILNYKPK